MRIPLNNKDIVYTQEKEIQTGKGVSDARKTRDVFAEHTRSCSSTW